MVREFEKKIKLVGGFKSCQCRLMLKNVFFKFEEYEGLNVFKEWELDCFEV